MPVAIESTAGSTRTPGLPERALRRPLENRVGRALEANAFVICVLAGCVTLHALFVRTMVVSDAWYTLLGGRIVSRSGLPHHDSLTTLTLGRAWVDQQWLAHLGLYALWAAGGWPLAGVAAVLLYLAAFAVTAGCARRLGASDRSVAIVTAWCFLTGLPNTAFRAQLPTYVLFGTVLSLLLGDARTRSRRVYLVFPLLVLWANLHGSVVLGAGLVALRGATVAVEGLRVRARFGSWLPRSAALLALPWLCILASPYGLALPGYYSRVLDNPAFAHSLAEWGPSTLRGQPFFFVLLLAALWLAARSHSALTPFAKLALAATAVFGLVAVRNDVWFALTASAIVPAAIDAAWAPGRALRRTGLNLALGAAGVAVIAVAVVSIAGRDGGWFERGYPQRAVTAVAAAAGSDPKLRVFADERYADWLLFEDPALTGRVAYDARIELLSARRLSEVVAFRTQSGLDWQRIARGYRLLVLDPVGDRAAVKYYRGLPGTAVLFRDKQVVVLRTA